MKASYAAILLGVALLMMAVFVVDFYHIGWYGALALCSPGALLFGVGVVSASLSEKQP